MSLPIIPGPAGFAASTTNFVATGDAISPTFMSGPYMAAYRRSMTILMDDLADGATAAVQARFPSKAPADAFQYISLDRAISQGFQEGQTSFILRLQQWLDLLSYQGLPSGIMAALLGYVLPPMWTPTNKGTSPMCRTVDNSSNWYTYASGANPVPLGPPTTRLNAPAGYPPGFAMLKAPTPQQGSGNWRWDSVGPDYGYGRQWWRLWVILYSVGGTPWAAPSATWAPSSGTVTVSVVADGTLGTVYSGSGSAGSSGTQFNWDDGTCWDWAGSSSQGSAITSLMKQCKAANVWVVNAIISYDSTMFDPTLAFGSSKLPDGTWGTWAKVAADGVLGTVYAASRPASTTCSFIAGSGAQPSDQFGPVYS